NEIGDCGRHGRSVEISRPAKNHDRLVFDQTCFAQAILQSVYRFRADRSDDTDLRRWLGLGPRRKRQRDEQDRHTNKKFPPPHSITSSARPSKVAGSVSPSSLAILRFTTISNLVGSCTGRS